MSLRLSNADARRIFLARQQLSRPRGALGKAGLLELIDALGFVQVDSIATVERAHHHILFARNPTYRREHLTALLEKDGALFEHWTHDAAIIPTSLFPHWKHRFARARATLADRWRSWHENGFETYVDHVLERVRREGPLMARDFEQEAGTEKRQPGWWNWHPEKTALEYHWRTGALAIAGRQGFQKVYDLAERVIPARHFSGEVSADAFVDWACTSALERLGFATSGEIAAFWDLVSPAEARAWVEASRDRLVPVLIEGADGGKPRASHAFADAVGGFDALPAPPTRLRVLSPFDPLLRDRDRAERLFGFNYRIEVFVPAPKRVYGYYVFPLLEGDRMIGRIDMKADRKAGTLDVRRLWLEPGVRASGGRLAALDAELARIGRFAGVERTVYLDGWRGE